MRSYCLLVIMAAGVLCSLRAHGQLSSVEHPEKMAEAFYHVICSNHIDGLPKGKVWQKIKIYLTPELTKRFQEAQRKQQEFIKRNPGEKPPWLEGSLFTSLFEGPNKFKIKKVIVKGKHAQIQVDLFSAKDQSVTRWTDTLLAQKRDEKWLIDDIRYGGSWDFANKGLLSKILD